MYDLPSIVFGFVYCLITGIIISLINYLVEKALYYRSERKYFKENMEVLENE